MRIIALILLLYSASIYAENIEFEVHDYTEHPDGNIVAKGIRKYKESDIQVDEKLYGDDVYWVKSLRLTDDYDIGVSVYREPEIKGFGIWVKKDNKGFSWEWFDITSSGEFCKRQETGTVSVRYKEYRSDKEVVGIKFDTDVSLRLNASKDINKDTHRIVIKKGSVLKFLPSASSLDSAPMECDKGNSLARTDSYQDSIPLLTKCINSETASLNVKRIAYESRASANNRLGDNQRAVEDIELAFAIVPPSQYYEFINYSLYLRLAGRSEDSLQIVKTAKMLDDMKGKVSMMTQYHLGWSYQELGRHQEAIKSFTLGIEKQPGFPYAYYRRSLSYEVVGMVDSAKNDIGKVHQLLTSSKWNHISDKELAPLREKIKEYGIQ